MKIIKSVKTMQNLALKLKAQGKTIGLVPTMGYLHQGHISLLKRIRKKCDILVVSVFVNPTQFAPNEDYDQYPRNMARDKKILAEQACDILFYPPKEKIYPKGYTTYVTVEGLSDKLCGKSRPGHFRGVATIVTKLFIITQCNIACFGRKDAQQAAIIVKMTKDLNLPVEIVVAPTLREKDGLAMSSRNVFLIGEERQNALCLKKALDMAANMVKEGKLDTRIIIRNMRKFIELVEDARIDYIEAVDPVTLEPKISVDGPTLFALAVFIGKTRLIDNSIIIN